MKQASNNNPRSNKTRHFGTTLEALRSIDTGLCLVNETPAAKIAQHAADKKAELDAIFGL